MYWRNLLMALIVVIGSGWIASPATRADTDAATAVRSFIAALNSGDVGTAEQLSAPNLTITLAGGRSLPVGSADSNNGRTIPAAFLPITIVSLTPEDDANTVDAVLQFGGLFPFEVQFHTINGLIDNMSVVTPS